jgi:hypothetical protein
METFAEELRQLIEKWLGFLGTDESDIFNDLMDEIERLEPDDD